MYEDDYLMVINKPAGMVVHPGFGNWNGTMLNAIAWHLKDFPQYDINSPEIGLVHRIDKDTSGLLVVAKTAEAKIYPDADACANVLQFPDYSFTSLYDLPANANTTLDCSAPVTILLRTYQDYMWTLNVRRQG